MTKQQWKIYGMQQKQSLEGSSQEYKNLKQLNPSPKRIRKRTNKASRKKIIIKIRKEIKQRLKQQKKKSIKPRAHSQKDG